jgi:hypothetical protein
MTNAGGSRKHEIKIEDLETHDSETKNLGSWLIATTKSTDQEQG